MSEERGLEQVGGHGACVHWDEGLVAACRVQVNRLGDDFFSGSAFSLKQHRRTTGGHLSDQVKNLQHGLALAHDVFEVVALLKGALQLYVFLCGTTPSHGSAYIGEEFLVVPRFLNEVCGPGLHGAHRIFDGAVCGDHDDGEMRIVRADIGENFHSAAAGKS